MLTNPRSMMLCVARVPVAGIGVGPLSDAMQLHKCVSKAPTSPFTLLVVFPTKVEFLTRIHTFGLIVRGRGSLD